MVSISRRHVRLGAVLAFVVAISPAWAQSDAAGARDHALFTRMNGFFIEEYTAHEFDAHEFTVAVAADEWETKSIEGRKTTIAYRLKEGATAPSGLQVIRNYVNAATQAGGKVLYENKDPGNRVVTLRVARNGRDIWAQVTAGDGWDGYNLTVVEVAALQQEVQANAIFDALSRDGRIALQIQFDTGKATIRSESLGQIGQAADALRKNPGLAVAIEGHTDNVGQPAANKTLSEQRARAVLAALVEHGVESARLSARGFGSERPVADNATEEGRARNRRVELVKR